MYTKLFASILDSTIWCESPATKVVWITMLAKSNTNGVVEASIPGLARAAGVTLEECEEALGKFLAPDPYSRTKDSEGRRIEEVDGGWLLLNHAKYRELKSREEQREQTRARVQKHRKKKRGDTGNASNARNASNESETECNDSRSASASASGSDSEREGEREGEMSPPPDDDRETMCPTDLVERAESVGVFERMADALREPKPSLVECAREFVGYWTIGAGAGKRRRQWMRKLREHLRRASLEHRLKPLGALEHEERTSSGDATHDKTKHLRDMARRMEGK